MFEESKFLLTVLYDKAAQKRFIGLRPVVSCLVTSRVQEDTEQELLLIKPASEPNIWIFPQEGMLECETQETASIRCLTSELGISENKIQFRRSFHAGDRIFGEDRKGERDLRFAICKMRGKAYFGGLLFVDRNVQIDVNESEVAGYEWVRLSEVASYISCVEITKKDILLRIIKELLGADISE